MLDVLVPPFVTADELDEYPGAPFEDLDIAIAVAIVRGICGWHIAPNAELTFELNSDGADVMLLPSYHITEVTSVKDGRDVDALDIVGWTWSHNGILGLPPCGRPRGLANVIVTASSGLENVPTDLLAVVADITKARHDSAARAADLKSKTVGGVSYTYADLASATSSQYARYAPILDRFTL